MIPRVWGWAAWAVGAPGSLLIHARCPCYLPAPRRGPNKFYKRANSWKMLILKNILREFACCSLLCGDGIYTPGISAAPHLRALYIAINYTLVVEWLSTGKLISHYPLSNIQHTAVNICISRKSSWLPLAGCRVSARVRGVSSPPAPAQKAFDSHCHSFHSKTSDPSLVWPQVWTREMPSAYSTLQSTSSTIMPASPTTTGNNSWKGNLWDSTYRNNHQICGVDGFMVWTLSTAILVSVSFPPWHLCTTVLLQHSPGLSINQSGKTLKTNAW